MKCPNCEVKITEVDRARSVRQQWDGDKWIEKDVYSDSIAGPNCGDGITCEDLEDCGMPLS